MEKADTIEFAYRSTGCSYHLENYMLVKKGNLYHLTGSYKRNGELIVIDKIIFHNIIDALNNIETQYRIKRQDIRRSTMNHEFFLLVKSKLFYFDENYSTDYYMYDTLKERYILKH